MAPAPVKKTAGAGTSKRTPRRPVKSAPTINTDDDFSPPVSKLTPRANRSGSSSQTKGTTSTATKVTLFSTRKMRPSDPVPAPPEVLEISSDEADELDEQLDLLDDDDLADFIVDDEAEEEENFDTESDDDDGTALVEGDNLYPEAAVPKTVRLSKRPVPTTPPLQTRRSAASLAKQQNSSPAGRESPTKKPRTEVVGKAEPAGLGEPFTPVKKRTSKAPPQEPPSSGWDTTPGPVHQSSKAKEKAKSKPMFKPAQTSEAFLDQLASAVEAGDEPVLDNAREAGFLDDLAGAVATGDRTVNSQTAGSNVFLEDLSVLTVKELPSVCEVTNLAAQDGPLAKKGFYKDLPNLINIQQEFNRVPNFPKEGGGHINFSSLWTALIPSFPVKTGLQTLLFTIDGDYVNLSRANPLELCARQLFGPHPKYEISTKRRTPAICLSPIMVTESYMQTLNPALRYSGHYLTGIFHTQEWSRCFSVIGMLANQSVIWTNMYDDALKFATKTNSSQDSAGKSILR
ncbi:hypothetical protein GALMADRAFT_148943 [Galerina marginata CBS 339.88]|uniref:Uncharacterized protein n=1 Tax=Galerina marginata (strain CBS 339.88) TaxID=685588 RepID=A0A067S5J0_GALM3|nr:hypothetical protein GALMADRAFT_148943 [Galerina marginata CBS 339.88]